MDRVVASAALALLLLLLAPRAGAGPSAVTSAEGSAESNRKKSKPKTWALLVAGSSGYWNYRHQVSDEAGALLKADVCHAYQLLRRGGLKEENIVVMMYDDIAYNPSNPRQGVIINKPGGKDVYAGVPKDYTGTEVNVKNMFAVLLGNKSAVEGGSGKVINSKPHDRIFVYYADHGGPGVLCMPKDDEYVYAKDFIEVLKKKHALKSYKEMVIYVEACESGSIFEGLLPKNLNIYVTTASSATESSWATYCPRSDEPPPPGYDTCLGDLYSVAWMEDSDSHNLRKETVGKQYQNVKLRTSNMKNATYGSHVMEYGDKSIKAEKLYQYQGFNPGNDNATENEPQWRRQSVVNQRDADLLFLWMRYEKADAGSEEKAELYKEITETILHRKHLDNNIEYIGKLIFGFENGPSILTAVRPSGQALVDDWDCLKSMVQVFESHCGPLTQYGVKHMRAFANLCNKGISKEAMERASAVACESYSLANHAVPAHH